MQSKSEHIVSQEPGLALRLQDETLKEPDRRVIISLYGQIYSEKRW